MIKQVILLLTFIPLVACKAENLQQKDIRDYINNAKTCEYLAGEAGEQEATEAEKLNKNIDKYCGLAQKQLTALEKKYRSNKTAMQEISKYKFDSVESYMANL